jgi:hypothetical protein
MAKTASNGNSGKSGCMETKRIEKRKRRKSVRLTEEMEKMLEEIQADLTARLNGYEPPESHTLMQAMKIGLTQLASGNQDRQNRHPLLPLDATVEKKEKEKPPPIPPQKEKERKSACAHMLDSDFDKMRQRYQPGRLHAFLGLAFPDGDQPTIRKWLHESQYYAAERIECAMQRTLDKKPGAPLPYYRSVLRGLTGPEILKFQDQEERPSGNNGQGSKFDAWIKGARQYLRTLPKEMQAEVDGKARGRVKANATEHDLEMTKFLILQEADLITPPPEGGS